MFIFTKRSGQRGRLRFLWWPLALSIVLSLALTIALNTALR
jgi:hypothetical protein